MSLPRDHCPRCDATRFRFGWQVFANGTKHIRVECAACGAYVCYAPQTPENQRRVGPPPEGGPHRDAHDHQD